MQLQVLIDAVIEGHKKIHKLVSFQYLLLFVLLYLLNIQDDKMKIEIWKNFDLTRGTTILYAVAGIAVLYICIISIARSVTETMIALRRENYHCYANLHHYPCLLNSGWRAITLLFPLLILYIHIGANAGKEGSLIGVLSSLGFVIAILIISVSLPTRSYTEETEKRFLHIWHQLFENTQVDLETFIEKALNHPDFVKGMTSFLGRSTSRKNIEVFLDSMIAKTYVPNKGKNSKEKVLCVFCKNNKFWFLAQCSKEKQQIYIYETTD